MFFSPFSCASCALCSGFAHRTKRHSCFSKRKFTSVPLSGESNGGLQQTLNDSFHASGEKLRGSVKIHLLLFLSLLLVLFVLSFVVCVKFRFTCLNV